jgi:hypothetical protein
MSTEQLSFNTSGNGTYWIGDPAFALPQDTWHELLRVSNGFETPIGSAGGIVVGAFRAPDGSGTYEDGSGRVYESASGYIGVVHASQISRKFTAAEMLVGAGHLVGLSNATCTANGDTIQFGEVVIGPVFCHEDSI